MAEERVDYPDYPVFKGLQKPLEFLGLSFLIGYIVFGFLVGLVLITSILGFGGAMTFIKQHKGLHSKKSPTGIFIFAHSSRY